MRLKFVEQSPTQHPEATGAVKHHASSICCLNAQIRSSKGTPRAPAACLTFVLPKLKQFAGRFCCLYRVHNGFETDAGPCMFSLGPRSQKWLRKNSFSAARAEEGFAVGTRVVGWSVCLPVGLLWCLTSIAVIHRHLRAQLQNQVEPW